ncbi:MAG TPA: hydroxymethylbilane synthase [Vicinamibacterales bacterium]|jgi:hydroxymethylbilane synthase
MSGLRIGTRGSALALWQAHAVASRLAGRGVTTEIVTYKTSGDRLQDAPLTDVGTKGLFVKELEDALLQGAIDVAVHSAKDMSVTLPEGLTVVAVLPREDPRDALVLPGAPPAAGLAEIEAMLGDAPAIGTGSIRRSAQLQARWPRARFAPIRGNVDTRLRKLDEGGFDALVLAAAGLRRLGHPGRITLALDPADCLPAPSQGIVAIEARANAPAVLAALNDGEAFASFRAERALVSALGGGCQLPLGALATHRNGALEMEAVVIAPGGTRQVRHAASGSPADPEELGRRLAGDLAARGAVAILDEVR